MNLNIRVIKSPSKATLDIIRRRLGSREQEDLTYVDALGLVQGKIIDMVCATDIAEKSAGVKVSDIHGSCPQHMVMIAIWGDTSSVESAISDIRNTLGKE